MAGPNTRGGGMAAVAQALVTEVAQAYPNYLCKIIDSGGGRGWKGYYRFPAAAYAVLFSKYDLLHLHVASNGSTIRKGALSILARVRRKPYVIHLHGGGYVTFVNTTSRLVRRLTMRFFDEADAVIVLSEYWRSFVTEDLAIPPHKVRIVSNGVHSPGIDPGQRLVDPYILFVGEVSPRKGVDLLLEAVREIFDDTTRKWRCVIMGRVIDPRIVVQAASLPSHIRHRISFTGVLSGAEKEAVIRRASLFVLPSRAEALPMSLLEAMAAQLPCVVTSVGSVPEIIVDHSNGILLPVGDKQALVRALNELIESEPLRNRLGHEAFHAWKQGFTVERLGRSVTMLWDDILDRKKGS